MNPLMKRVAFDLGVTAPCNPKYHLPGYLSYDLIFDINSDWYGSTNVVRACDGIYWHIKDEIKK